MTDCIIRNNNSTNTGSAGTVRTDGNGNYRFTMSGGEIYGNYSECFGSGLYWNAAGKNSLLIVKDGTKIYNNEAVKQGKIKRYGK